MLTVSIQLPSDVSEDDLALALYGELHNLIAINARWYRSEWNQGRDPPCCAGCAKVRYRPDPLGPAIGPLLAAPVLYKRGVGSCGPIAAAHAGHKVAEAVKQGLMSWEDARQRFDIRLQRAPLPAGASIPKGGSAMNLHAVCWDDGKIVDPTKEMVRA